MSMQDLAAGAQNIIVMWQLQNVIPFMGLILVAGALFWIFFGRNR